MDDLRAAGPFGLKGAALKEAALKGAARALMLAGLALAMTACTTATKPEPQLQILYNRTAQYHGPDRNPVIVIPGILGSKLVDRPSSTRVWGAFVPGAADPQTAEGLRLVALPIRENTPLRDLRDEVEPDGVLDRVKVRLGIIPLEIRAYVGILAALGAGGYRDESLGLNAIDYGDEHFTCFQFDYDWRRDNVENAKRLKDFIEEKRAYVSAEYKKRFGIDKQDVKFDIVAHSMGGLVTRYFLRYGDQDLGVDGSPPELNWAGAEYVDRAILVGTPSAGSANAFTQLMKGKNLGPFLPYYQPALLGTFPSIYQLLPRPRHGMFVWDGDKDRPIDDLLDADLWIEKGWGLASPEAEPVLERLLPEEDDPERRRVLAQAVLRGMLMRAGGFMEALDKPAGPPEGLELFLVAGDAKDTPRTLSVDSTTGVARVLDYAGGDGTVLRSSALMDEREGGEWSPTLVSPVAWRSVMFLFSDHLGLTQDPAFTDNVLYWLLEEPRAKEPS